MDSQRNYVFADDADDYDENEDIPYTFPGTFRPTSLSIVTVTPEILKSIQKVHEKLSNGVPSSSSSSSSSSSTEEVLDDENNINETKNEIQNDQDDDDDENIEQANRLRYRLRNHRPSVIITTATFDHPHAYHHKVRRTSSSSSRSFKHEEEDDDNDDEDGEIDKSDQPTPSSPSSPPIVLLSTDSLPSTSTTSTSTSFFSNHNRQLSRHNHRKPHHHNKSSVPSSSKMIVKIGDGTSHHHHHHNHHQQASPSSSFEHSLLRYVLSSRNGGNNLPQLPSTSIISNDHHHPRTNQYNTGTGNNANVNIIDNFDTISSITNINTDGGGPRNRSILKKSNSRDDGPTTTSAAAASISNIDSGGSDSDSNGGGGGGGDDDISIGPCSIANHTDSGSSSGQEKLRLLMNYRLMRLLSIMYAVTLVTICTVLTVGDIAEPLNNWDNVYSILLTAISFAFLLALHIDIQRHKRFVMKWEAKRKETIEAPLREGSGYFSGVGSRADTEIDMDAISITTAIIFNRTYRNAEEELDETVKERLNSYKFLTGKHSGNFYLKIGITIFCMGSIVHQGLEFSKEIHYHTHSVDECKNWLNFIVYLIRCVLAFYQLYMAFKYSNLIINCHQFMAMFGTMHLIGTSISFWFATIIQESIESYAQKVRSLKPNATIANITDDIVLKDAVKHILYCEEHGLTHGTNTLNSLPYLYPFSIELNIILAAVWIVLWTNIDGDAENKHSALHHIREEIEEDVHTGMVDINYRSNITISADCHASNMGLFGGLFAILVILITTILFFTTIDNEQYHNIGVSLYTGQFGFLATCLLATVALAFPILHKLNVIHYSELENFTTVMDDLLMLFPLPFYYLHHTLCIYSECKYGTANSIIMAIIYAINLLQITMQTVFIIDAIRRCSNERKFRYEKPGKNYITFVLILNAAMWFFITFEIKHVDKYHSMQKIFGKFEWMLILDSCLPLMLFYRFHSSVCLSEIWQNAYEKDNHHH